MDLKEQEDFTSAGQKIEATRECEAAVTKV